MDRRRLIVGGTAAAAATTLAALTGSGISAAAAARIAARMPSTEDHARRVLDSVDVDRGLVNPAGLQRIFEQNYQIFLDSTPREPGADDLDAWGRQRLMELCRTDSYVDAVMKLPDSRTLLAFSFLAYSQHQEVKLPPTEQAMRVPTVLRALEPDFFPVLLRQVNEKSKDSRPFATALQATLSEVDRIIADKIKEYPEAKGWVAMSPRNGQEAVAFIVGVTGFIAFLYWIKGGLK